VSVAELQELMRGEQDFIALQICMPMIELGTFPRRLMGVQKAIIR
jgi:hypothetical protein